MRPWFCAYCGPSKPMTVAELHEHLEVCSMHPMAAIKVECDRRGLAERTWRGHAEKHAAERDRLRAALSDCMNSLQESDFCLKLGCGDARCERARSAWNAGHEALATTAATPPPPRPARSPPPAPR